MTDLLKQIWALRPLERFVLVTAIIGQVAAIGYGFATLWRWL